MQGAMRVTADRKVSALNLSIWPTKLSTGLTFHLRDKGRTGNKEP